MAESKPIRLALLGCGTVGGGVLEILRDNARYLSEQVGAPIEVSKVLVRNADKARTSACKPEWITTNPDEVFSDPDLDLVVEVMGGVDPARGYLTKALEKRCGIVTANKMLLAFHGPELIDQAVEAGVDLAFEASVGGGIPIIRTLRDALTGDWVTRFAGIVNGTCNYVLTSMQRDGLGFDEAVKEAQRLGYAEADPSLDVDGHDATQKLVVSAMLAFGARVKPSDVPVEGIRTIDARDHEFAGRFGFTFKHLAIGRDHGEALELRVHPTLVAETSMLANVSDVLCAVHLHGRVLGPAMLSGAGAGTGPTAVSVVADLVDVAKARTKGGQGVPTRSIQMETRKLLDPADSESRYYLRFGVKDAPGVLASIAGGLGKCGVSIEKMVQDGRGGQDDEVVEVVLITHQARWGDVQKALKGLGEEAFVLRAPKLFRIEDF